MSYVWSLVTGKHSLALTLNLGSISDQLKLEKAMKSFGRIMAKVVDDDKDKH